MAFLDGTGLGYLLGKIKDAFVAKADTQTVTGVDIDSAPTKSSAHLVESGGVFSDVHPTIGTTQPFGGMLPNVVYDLGTLTGTVTFGIASALDNTIANAYHWTFETGSTEPTITWPSGIIWPGNGNAPTVEANCHYEIFIRNGYGTYLVFDISS